MAVIGVNGNILTIPNKRFIHRDPQALVGNPLVGSGECVALIQRYFPAIGNTRTWKAGQRVVESRDIKIGTVIGTMVEGEWPGLAHGNHVGLFGGVNGRSIQTGFMTSRNPWKNGSTVLTVQGGNFSFCSDCQTPPGNAWQSIRKRPTTTTV